MIKVDLHTHSTASPDGGIKPEEYIKILEDGLIDYIAITDHNSINMALELSASLGKHIIVGEEITAIEGELIGLFLTKPVEPGKTAKETAKAIRAQGGIVYVPHPFETVRKGLSEITLNGMTDEIDMVEVHNGRAVFQNKGPQAATWARLNHKLVAASSDAHGLKGLGTTYSVIAKPLTRQNFSDVFIKARFVTNRPPLRSLLYPKANRLKKRFL